MFIPQEKAKTAQPSPLLFNEEEEKADLPEVLETKLPEEKLERLEEPLALPEGTGTDTARQQEKQKVRDNLILMEF